MSINQLARQQDYYTVSGLAQELQLQAYQIHNAIKVLNIPTQYIDKEGQIYSALPKGKRSKIIHSRYLPTIKSYYKLYEESESWSSHDYSRFDEEIDWAKVILGILIFFVYLYLGVWAFFGLLG